MVPKIIPVYLFEALRGSMSLSGILNARGRNREARMQCCSIRQRSRVTDENVIPIPYDKQCIDLVCQTQESDKCLMHSYYLPKTQV